MEDNEIVMPGDKLATEEEFLPSKGTFNENNYIYSLLIGDLLISRGKIGVKSKIKDIMCFDRGNMVLCKISDTLPSVLFADLSNIQVNEKYYIATKDGKITKPKYEDRDVTSKRINLLDYNPGDLLLARIKYNDDDSYTLDITGENELGVVLSLCDSCGNIMSYDEKLHMLVCNNCKHVKNKIISECYGDFNKVVSTLSSNL